MKFSFELPVRRDNIFILDKKDNIVAMIEYPDDDADYIVQAINSHKKLVDTLKKFRDECDDNNHNKHHKEFHHMCKICVIDEALKAVEKL